MKWYLCVCLTGEWQGGTDHGHLACRCRRGVATCVSERHGVGGFHKRGVYDRCSR